MNKNRRAKEPLLAENEDLRRRLEEAEETLRAIHEGQVDALVLSKPEGEVVFTLKGAEYPYRVFVEAMNEGAVTLDPGGTILYCNDRFAGMLQIPTDRVIGSSIYAFVPIADRSIFESAFQGGKQQETTADIFLQKGEQAKMPVHLSFSVLRGQEMSVVCMVAMDLTEHKRLEEELRLLNAQLEQRVQDRTAELRESEQRYRGIVETAQEGIATHNPDGAITYVNQRMADMLGYPREEIIGRPSLDFVEEEEREAVIQARETLKERGSFSQERKLRRKNGSALWTLSNVSPRRDGAGNFIGYLAMHTDITERKQAELALTRARDQLEERVRERTKELTDAVTMLENEIVERERLESELRNSEKQIRSFASQILTAQETERRRIARELHDSVAGDLTGIKLIVEKSAQKGLCAAEMEDLTFKLRSTIEETRRIMTALRPAVLDDLGVLAALGWLSREFNQTHPDVNVSREFEVQETLIPDALKTPIFRITQEALNNISKHSKADLVTIWLRKKGASIELMIEDNGRGFDVADAFSTERYGTGGLGLSGMRERAELSGAIFSIESAPGSGTKVKATWPMQETEANGVSLSYRFGIRD